MRRSLAPRSRRRDEAVLAEIRASLDNQEPGARTPAAAVRLLPQAVKIDDGETIEAKDNKNQRQRRNQKP